MDTKGSKILFVDDEINLLHGIQRSLRKVFDIHTANGGEQGLIVMEREGPFSVVVSDMRMPGMDGSQFLAAVRKEWPDTVRVMLTGESDLDTTIAAVNEGNIFRFLTKPCPPETLALVVKSCVRQYQLVKSERELLEKTLKGSIKIMFDMLSLTNPAAFGRALRIRECVAQITKALDIPDAWQYEVAAMLSQIGYVTIPSETMEKIINDEILSDSEKKMINSHSDVAKNLIINIPRLEFIVDIITEQEKRFEPTITLPELKEKPELIGAQILKVSIDFDALLVKGISHKDAVNRMEKQQGVYNPLILTILKNVKPPTFEKIVKRIKIYSLRSGMSIAEDIRGNNGVLLVAKNQTVSDLLRRRLENSRSQGYIGDTILVYMSQQSL